MDKEKKLILRFTGDKVELKNQLKAYCAIADKSMNGTIIELVEQLLDTKDFKIK